MRRHLSGLGLAALCLGLVTSLAWIVPPAASADAHQASSPCGAQDGTHPSTLRHVMVILMENHSAPSIVGSSSAPYINSLISGCGYASDYHAYSHPSLPNYLALTSGEALGKAVTVDCLPAGCPQSQPSIFGQGETWRTYAEAMPSNCYGQNYDNTKWPNANGTTGEYYYPRHTAAPYYPAIASQCKTWDEPMGHPASGALHSALSPSADKLPAFSLVVPGGCDDMHDCNVTAGDDWLKEWVPVITQSAAYQAGQLAVFITWDEGEGGAKSNGENCTASSDVSCHVALIVLSEHVIPGTVVSGSYSHLSTLATAEDLLGLPRLATVSGQASMAAAFGL